MNKEVMVLLEKKGCLLIEKNNNEKVLRYSIRKLTVGVVSIACRKLVFLWCATDKSI